MLTIDDINSINEKYEDIGFWIELDFRQFDISRLPTSGSLYFYQNGFTIEFYQSAYDFRINIQGRNFDLYYATYPDGTLYPIQAQNWGPSDKQMNITPAKKQEYLDSPFIFHIFIGKTPSISNFAPYERIFIPLQSTCISMVNGEYNDKFYIYPIGQRYDGYLVDNQRVSAENDEKGLFIRLPPHDCTIGVYDDTSLGTNNYLLYYITFYEFKTLPILSIPTVYKGNTQTIQLMNDTEEITEFQAYYKGELLNDNKITLPYDADDYIDITVDLQDNRYPNSTLKLKAPTQMYIANSQSDVETAIANGITTLQVGDTGTEVSLNGIDLTNVQLVNSNIQLTNSTLNNCTILNSQYTDNGANNINNTNFNECEITTTSISTYTDCTITECTILNSELHITGTLQDNTFNNSLIVSDGEITLTNNTFTGIGSKTYFPSHLYLTGDYTLQNNIFTMTGTFTELQFNMCLIKATNDFNVSEFINKNTFQLNITYESEPTSTLYYNIVDDDKIRARRL